MATSSEICRDVLDTGEVLKQQLSSTLVESLMNEADVSSSQCKQLSVALGARVDAQLDALVDRILKKLDSKP